MLKHKLVDFIIQFMEEVDKEISEMKLFVSNSPLAAWSSVGVGLLTAYVLYSLMPGQDLLPSRS